MHDLLSQEYSWLQEIEWRNVDSGFQAESSFYFNFLRDKVDTTYSVFVDDGGHVKIENEKYYVFTKILNDRIPEGALIFQNAFNDTTHVLYFREGKLHGNMLKLINFDTLAIVQYEAGLKHGRQFEKQGAKIITCQYKQGLLNGKYMEYRLDTNCLLKFVSYKNGEIDGLLQSNHDNGLLKIMLIYSLGKVVDGRYYSFFSDGDIRSVLVFEGGVLIKEEEFFNIISD
jgi:antitoxin component YwqK of YwqJK toxin-antitoxin module